MKITKKIAAVSVASAALAGAGASAGVALGSQPPAHNVGHVVSHRARTARPAATAVAATHDPAAARNDGDADRWVTVQAGDTLSGIAAVYHISWQALYATPPNPRILDGGTVLQVGERLRIPADPKLRAAQFAASYAATLDQGAASGQQSAQPAASQASQAGQPVPASASAFEQCVAWRESSDTPTDPDGLFGILPSTWAELGYSGTAGQAPVSLQQVAFNRLYAEYGTQPWAPSDGC